MSYSHARLLILLKEQPGLRASGYCNVGDSLLEYEADCSRYGTQYPHFTVEQVYLWLASVLPTAPGRARWRSSYGLKHTVERRMGGYLANGTLIAAALLLGIHWRVQRDENGKPTPNLNFFVKELSLPRGQWE